MPDWLRILGWSCLLVAMAIAVWRAQWHLLRQAPARVHLLAASTLGVICLWLMKIRAIDHVTLHLLGVTTVTLVLGWRFAVTALSTALLGFALLSDRGLAMLGLDWLLCVLVPASTTRLLQRALVRPTLRNPFVFMLGAGFAGGALAVLSSALGAAMLLIVAGHGDLVAASLPYLALLPLIMFSEAFINGTCVSALAVFIPDCLKTFDDHFYLQGPK